MPSKHVLSLALSPEAAATNAADAEVLGISPARHAELVLEEALRQRRTSGKPRLPSSEGALLRIVRAICAELRDTGWEPDVTLRVFDRIRLENLQLYQDAVSASDHPRLNRAIGALVKKCLGAEPVRRPNGTIAMRYTKPADGHLIKAYTLLQPTEAISHE